MEANLLTRHWSPESISHPTITRWIAKDRAAGGQLYRCLWSSGRKRWKGGKRLAGNAGKEGSVTGRAGTVFLTELTSVNALKKWIAVFGDWEGGTVKGGSMYFVILPERFSRLFSARVKAAHTDT